MKERIFYLDILRIIAILSVILCHISASEWQTTPLATYNWQICNAYESMVRFCVPVLFMVSGCLFLDPGKKLDIKKLYSKNILRIVIAFVFWSFCYASLQFIKAFITGTGITWEVINCFRIQFMEGHFHLWFLFAIVSLYIAVPVLRMITADRKITKYFLTVAFITGSVIPLLQKVPVLSETELLTKDMNLFFFYGYSFYFILGYYINTCEISRKQRSVIYLLGILSTIITIVGTSIISLYEKQASSVLFTFLTPNVTFQALAVFIGVKQLCTDLTLRDRFKNAIYRISDLTFGIYLVHVFVQMTLSALGFGVYFINPLLSVPVITVLTFILSMALIWIIAKIPILKRYII